MPKYLVYVRSSDKSETSIENQLTAIFHQIKKDAGPNKNPIVYKEYGSGQKITHAFNAMYTQIISLGKEVEVILYVYNISRLIRKKPNLEMLMCLLGEYNLTVISLEKYFVTYNRLNRNLLLLKDLAEESICVVSCQTGNILQSFQFRKSQNGCKGGKSLYGYNAILHRKKPVYCINEAEAKVIRLIFDFNEKGFSNSEITKHLNLNHYKNQIGGDITNVFVRKILSREDIYRGLAPLRDLCFRTEDFSENNILAILK